MDFPGQIWLILGCCLLGLLWALLNLWLLLGADLAPSPLVPAPKMELLRGISAKIADGAKEFLRYEYLICGALAAVLALVIFGCVDHFRAPYTAVAFIVGAGTSMACGALAMVIATASNYRTTYQSAFSLHQGFRTAYRAGITIGFGIVSIALLVLVLLLVVFRAIKEVETDDQEEIRKLFEALAGYGLGGSFVALFGRVGGGIYTKAADVGADLVGKVERDLPEDSHKNPATIADNVGDNVGDIAGMGADLFGSFAESASAALICSATLLKQQNRSSSLDMMLFPVMLVALGIPACLLASTLALYLQKVDHDRDVQRLLKYQLLGSTLLALGSLMLAMHLTLPSQFLFGGATHSCWDVFLCAGAGLVAGFLIGLATEYVTSFSYRPVQELAEACSTGTATNIIYGLSLGYFSTFLPVVLIGLTAFLSLRLLGYYGVALAALGMLANLPISLAIDSYGPISDNAGGIAQMAELAPEVRTRTDALDAAGNTTAAIGKGFAIGSAALVGLSLFGGFLSSAGRQGVDLTQPLTFLGLLLGAMLPYLFSAFTMKSVGKAALGMVAEVRRQIKEKPGILTGQTEPDYNACVRISTKESLKEMILPGLLVVLTPLLGGIILGPGFIAGLLPGALVSGVQMAISAANTGGAWDNAKKYIEGGRLFEEEKQVLKGSETHKAAVVGDTVGDPLKDTSGPSLNILIKLLAILSLVFSPFFKSLHS